MPVSEEVLLTDVTFTRSDLEALLADPSPKHQAEAATRIAGAWRAGTLDGQARAQAEILFRVIADQAAVAVRAALADAVKDEDTLPHDVAMMLASDVDHVALPMLEASSVLTDDDLLALLVETSPAGKAAIAGRPVVSAQLADAVVEHGDEQAVARLVGNPGATLSERTLDRVVDRHGKSDRVAQPLVGRTGLPARVAERLVHIIAGQLHRHLLASDAVAPDVLADLILQSRERATLGLAFGVGQNLEDFIETLDRNGRLTPTLIMRALLIGDYLFFESALARRAGIPIRNVNHLINDPGGTGIARLFTAASMPDAQLPLVRVALAAAEETELRDEPDARRHYRELVVQRILTGFGDRVDTESVDYMITKIGRSQAVAAA